MSGSTEEAAGAEPDAEVSFVTRDLTTVLPRAKLAAVLPLDEVIARVREAANWDGGSSQTSARDHRCHPGQLPMPPSATSTPMRASSLASCRRTSRCFRRRPSQVTGGNAWNERTVAVKKGDSVAAILRDLGRERRRDQGDHAALGARGRDSGLKDGQKLRVLLAPVPAA